MHVENRDRSCADQGASLGVVEPRPEPGVYFEGKRSVFRFVDSDALG
jgi:hypothetical protein